MISIPAFEEFVGVVGRYAARFQAVCVAWSWFRQSGVISSRPPAGNANRWAAECYYIRRSHNGQV
jgi:hypothetical protein